MSQEIPTEYQELATKIGYRKPRFPFVSFKCRKAEILSPNQPRESEIELETGLRAYDTIININVDGTHRQIDKLEKIIRKKNWLILGWGNFPKPDSVKAKMTRSSSEDIDDWSKLDQFLTAAVNKQITDNATISGLNKKVADLEAKLSKAK